MIRQIQILSCITLLMLLCVGHCARAQSNLLPGNGQVTPHDSSSRKYDGTGKNSTSDHKHDSVSRKNDTAPWKNDSTSRKMTTKKPPVNLDSLSIAELKKLYPPDIVNTFVYDFFATFNGVHYENARTSDQHNEVNAQYNITLNNTFQYKKFTLRSYFYDEYGVRYFIDSVAMKGADNIQVRYSLQWKLYKSLGLQASFAVKSQLFPTYQYRDNGNNETEKYLYTDYFSPGYFIYTCGLSYDFLENASINLGLASGKTTRIRNLEIFQSRKATRLYGIDTGSRKAITYGVNLTVGVPPQMLNKHFGWECNAYLFASKEQLGRLKGYTVDVSNAFHYMFFKHMRVSLKTNILYDEFISDKIFMMNSLVVGFYLSNRL